MFFEKNAENFFGSTLHIQGLTGSPNLSILDMLFYFNSLLLAVSTGSLDIF